MLRNPDPEGYMCSKLLDMMEKVPFYKIKVTEFCRFAAVSRSAFYAHFDSIYDVIQKIEDDFFAGMPSEKDYALEGVSPEEREQALHELMRANTAYTDAHIREIRILLSENGEPAFRARLARRIRTVTRYQLEDADVEMTALQRNLIIEYIVGGQVNATWWMASHPSEVDAKQAYAFSVDVAEASFEGIIDSYRENGVTRASGSATQPSGAATGPAGDDPRANGGRTV